MPNDAVLLERDEGIATIRLNRPDNRNSMTPDLLSAFGEAVEEVADGGDVRCVIVTGTGSSFCAGADFKSSRVDESKPPHERQYELYSHFLRLTKLEVPTIAAMNGHAIGGGLGLALVCDLRVANAGARYGANFVRLGLHPGMATTYLLPHFVGVPRALELLLTGRIISGEEAAELGLANYAVPAGEVMDRATALASEIASAAPIAVRWTKRAIYEGLEWRVERAAHYEAMLQSRSMETTDFREGVSALLEKRPAKFRGR
jgi:enoyl-CoA hydratase/carnithine racemase